MKINDIIIEMENVTDELDLSGMDITTDEAIIIANLLTVKFPNIHTICLSSNNISNDGFLAIMTVKTLINVDVMGNNITYVNPNITSYIKNLNISWNPIGNVGINNLINFNIEHLDAYDCKITDLSDFFKYNTSVTNMDVSENNVGLKGIQYNHTLKELDMTHCHSYDLKDIEHNNTLTRLGLSSNSLGDDDAILISKNNSLNYVCLAINHITDKGAEHLANMKNLKVIVLCHNSITNMGLYYLARNPNIEYINLSCNNIDLNEQISSGTTIGELCCELFKSIDGEIFSNMSDSEEED